MKKVAFTVLLVLLLSIPFSLMAKGSQEQAVPGKEKVVFYGKIVEYTSTPEMMQKMKEMLGNKYDIDDIQVDWANLERVVKTGIASGDPADVYQYWPMLMKPFVDGRMALDLTPYLMANGGEWYNTFNKALIELGNYGGKYYGLPLNSNFVVVYINKKLVESSGAAINPTWNWTEFMETNRLIKEKTAAYPFVIASNPDVQSWLFKIGLQGAAADKGKLKDVAAGKVSATDPIFAAVLNNINDLYRKNYWYPGEGALSISRDEAQAAFYQGKVAMIAEVSSFAKMITENADFEIATVLFPVMGNTPIANGGADGLFIPANAKNPDASVEVLKTYLGADIQAIHAKHGYAAANKNVQVSDPLIASLIELSKYIVTDDFTVLSPKIKDFCWAQIVPEYLLGKDLNTLLDQLEKMRTEAIQ